MPETGRKWCGCGSTTGHIPSPAETHVNGKRCINEIVHGKRGITADTALRLARYFGTTERFSLNLQSRYELEVERDRLASTLDQIEPLATV